MNAPEGTRIDFVEYHSGSLESNARGKFLNSPRIFDHLQHTCVIVTREKIESVLRFYRHLLGSDEVWRYETTPGDLRLIELRLPGKRHDIIELMIHCEPWDRNRIRSMSSHQF